MLVERTLCSTGDDEYVRRVAALVGISDLDHRLSVYIRQMYWEHVPARTAARRVWEYHAYDYRPSVPF